MIKQFFFFFAGTGNFISISFNLFWFNVLLINEMCKRCASNVVAIHVKLFLGIFSVQLKSAIFCIFFVAVFVLPRLRNVAAMETSSGQSY